MALDPAVLAGIREWVGSTPDDATIEAVYTRVGTVEGSALSILRQRRADLMAGPASWAVEGDYREDRTANLKMLDELIAQLEPLAGVEGSTVTTSRLVRCDRRR